MHGSTYVKAAKQDLCNCVYVLNWCQWTCTPWYIVHPKGGSDSREPPGAPPPTGLVCDTIVIARWTNDMAAGCGQLICPIGASYDMFILFREVWTHVNASQGSLALLQYMSHTWCVHTIHAHMHTHHTHTCACTTYAQPRVRHIHPHTYIHTHTCTPLLAMAYLGH